VSMEKAVVAIAPPFSASVSLAKARGRGRRVSASERVEVSARCSNPRLGSRRGGDSSAWTPRGDALLPERHDMAGV
jgi:hypothetical protein